MQETPKKGHEVRNLIGGAWEGINVHETEPVQDPATGEVVAETPPPTREDVDRAAEAARGDAALARGLSTLGGDLDQADPAGPLAG